MVGALVMATSVGMVIVAALCGVEIGTIDTVLYSGDVPYTFLVLTAHG